MKSKIICLIAIFTFFGVNAQAPGGVAESEMWSKVIKNVSPITTYQYKNFSKNTKAITVGVGATLTPSLLNFNYSYTFNATSFVSYMSKLESINDATIFIVNQPSQTGSFALMNSDWNLTIPPVGINEQAFNFSTEMLKKNSDEVPYPSGSTARKNARINSIVWHSFNSKKIVNSYGSTGENSIFVGKGFTGAANFTGEIPEFIVYRKALNNTEKLRIESYLALKYGITLHKNQNYINSKAEVYWHKENNTLFKERIFGIGRDNNSTLYQRQSVSSHDPSKLIFWTGNLLANNYLNTANIEDNSYLTIGDNGGSEKPVTVLDKGIKKIDRTWLTEKFGAGMHNLVTNLKYKKDPSITLLPNEAFWLIIDRGANNSTASTFNGSNLEYYQVTSFDANGYSEFNNIRWASTTTTYNQFTFGVGPKMLVQPAVTFIDCNSGSLSVEIKGGLPSYTVNVHGTNNNYNHQFNTLSSSFSEILNVGEYLVTVTDTSGYVQEAPAIVTALPGIILELGNDYVFASGTVIDATLQVTNPNVAYDCTWTAYSDPTAPVNITSEVPPTYTPTESGFFTCTITNNDNGCVISDTLTILNRAARPKNYSLAYPNPLLTGEDFTIEVATDELGEIEIAITDVTGKILQSENNPDLKYFQKKYSILTSGLYLVKVKTKNFTNTHKIIIN